MKSSRKFSFLSSSSSSSSSSTATTVTFTVHHNDQSIPKQTKQIPIQSPPSSPKASATRVKLSQPEATARIQSAYRSHVIRKLYKKISAVDREADQLQRLIQRQDTVDSIRSDDREKLRMNEALMSLLLRLDSVPGVEPAVREARRKVSRRVVGLQEILDSVAEAKGYGYDAVVDDYEGDFYGWGPQGFGARSYWEETAEEEVCREMGGEELDNFCAQYLGFRCLQRFLRE